MTWLGIWRVDPESLYFRDSKTAFVRSDDHESGVFKFPAGVPQAGEPVVVHIGWDVCLKRGDGKHRPLAKRMIRVKPMKSFPEGSADWRYREIKLEEGEDRAGGTGLYRDPLRGPWLTRSDWAKEYRSLDEAEYFDPQYAQQLVGETLAHEDPAQRK